MQNFIDVPQKLKTLKFRNMYFILIEINNINIFNLNLIKPRNITCGLMNIAAFQKLRELKFR